jgi:exodeoxyribonuclease V alpha subunit
VPYFSGRVSTVVFSSSDFAIIKIVLDGHPSYQTTSVRGNFANLKVKIGSWVGFDGNWDDHPQYGRQLLVKRYPLPPPQWTPEVAKSLLIANGIGSGILNVLESHLQDDLVLALDEGVTSLESAPLDDYTKEQIITIWRKSTNHLKTLSYLYDSGVPAKIVSKVWSKFGDDAPSILVANPWSILKIDGVQFAHADEVAYKLGVDMSSPYRARGAVQYVLKSARTSGHLYLTPEEILTQAKSLAPNVELGDTLQICKDMSTDGSCYIEEIDEVTAVYDPWAYQIEHESASELVSRFKSAHRDLASAQDALEQWASGSKIRLTEKQHQAALHALTEPVSIITGLPGTGKTTTLTAVVRVLMELGVPFLLCAPTGIAAKRMASVTSAPAHTVHRAFRAKASGTDEERESTYAGIVGDSAGASDATGAGEVWEFNPKNPHPAHVVVVDESSMLDQHLLYRIIHGTSPNCRLVFVGDAAQLPSVGPGDVLRQMVMSGVFPVVALTEIFRQASLSGIVVASHDIHNGTPPKNDGKDFIVTPAVNEETAASVITQIAEKLYAARKNFQILSPRHAGSAGVTALNQRLRAVLNPPHESLMEHRIGSDVIRENDRVMIVKNDYELEVYNGDVGKVMHIDRTNKTIDVLIHGSIPAKVVSIPMSDAASKMRLAYAQTVHKSQGQEYDVIVAPILSNFGQQLQRNLYYTAVTRAKRKVVLVGTEDAIARAVANDHADKRNTLLSSRIKAHMRVVGSSDGVEDTRGESHDNTNEVSNGNQSGGDGGTAG